MAARSPECRRSCLTMMRDSIRCGQQQAPVAAEKQRRATRLRAYPFICLLVVMRQTFVAAIDGINYPTLRQFGQ